MLLLLHFSRSLLLSSMILKRAIAIADTVRTTEYILFVIFAVNSTFRLMYSLTFFRFVLRNKSEFVCVFVLFKSSGQFYSCPLVCSYRCKFLHTNVLQMKTHPFFSSIWKKCDCRIRVFNAISWKSNLSKLFFLKAADVTFPVQSPFAHSNLSQS